MIIARIFGGLGNQLFQYGTARAISARACVPLALDIREANRQVPHLRYALDHFDIEATIARPEDLPPDRTERLRYALWRYLGGTPKFTREKQLGLNRDLLTLGDGHYLHGYFQTERYFEDIAPKLRRELRIVTPPSDENRAAMELIRSGPSASVHLRRGDYVSSQKGAATHGTCDAEYYARALAHIAQATDREPRVFVFSDDPDWARDNLKLGFETHVFGQNGPLQHYEDLRLMSACEHNVIANSTFSWWGGWLNASEDAIVVAPTNWYADPKLKNPDIIPERWVRL
ncbi:MAG: alpha-1,2-fucosyltransferase [Litoreibacter sp.]|nr:alpha-1,2-fucosyltransferase [Litoreibacter sp.]